MNDEMRTKFKHLKAISNLTKQTYSMERTIDAQASEIVRLLAELDKAREKARNQSVIRWQAMRLQTPQGEIANAVMKLTKNDIKSLNENKGLGSK